MALLPRALQKIFGLTGGASEFGKIGSKAAGAPVTTKDLELMQTLTEYDQGMNAIVSDQGTSVLPYLEDINSLFFLTTSQIAYLFQAGIPEWDDETEYYLDVSLVVEGGITYKDTFGTGGTPNLNFQPSTNPTKWEPVLGLRAVDFESKDLIINVQTADTVTAWFTRLSLLDSNYIPKYLNDKALTWDITTPGVLEPGTTRKPSTDYGMWVDSEEILVLAPDLESQTDSTVAGFLVDSGATLLTDLVHDGDIAFNLDTKQKTTVSVDAALEDRVAVTDDIFPSGSNYKIVKMSPVGLGANRERAGSVYNDSGDVLSDSWYTQPQDEKFYSEEDVDFSVTSNPAVTVFNSSLIGVRQLNDWTGRGIWKIDGNVRYQVASGSRTSVTMTISGIINKTGLGQAITAHNQNSVSPLDAIAASAINTFTFNHASGSTNNYSWQFNIEQDKKPLFHL